MLICTLSRFFSSGTLSFAASHREMTYFILLTKFFSVGSPSSSLDAMTPSPATPSRCRAQKPSQSLPTALVVFRFQGVELTSNSGSPPSCFRLPDKRAPRATWGTVPRPTTLPSPQATAVYQIDASPLGQPLNGKGWRGFLISAAGNAP